MRILFVLFEGGGNVPPQLGIAKRLVARGQAVHVLGDAAVERHARASGCTFTPYRHAPHQDMRDPGRDLVRDWEPANPLKQLARVADQLLFGPAALYARDVLEVLEREPVDALAVDYLLFGALAAAEKSGLPTFALMHTVYTPPTEGVPPYGLGLPPAKGPLGRLRDRVLTALTRRTFEKLGRDRLNAARAGLGLAPVTSIFDQVLQPRRVLVLTPKRFDLAGAVTLPGHVRFVGAQLDDPGWAEPWHPPAALTREGDPVVLVALGSTFQNQKALTQRTIDAVGGMPVRALVTLGNVFAPEEFTAPPNVTVVRSAPHGAVMPLSRVVVAHGGHGTVIKALGHGKPVLCLPLGRDQKDNAVRVEAVDAGLRLSAGASASKIRRALERLLSEPRFEEAARRLAADIAHDTREDRATTEIESVAPVSRPDRAPILQSVASG